MMKLIKIMFVLCVFTAFFARDTIQAAEVYYSTWDDDECDSCDERDYDQFVEYYDEDYPYSRYSYGYPEYVDYYPPYYRQYPYYIGHRYGPFFGISLGF